MDGKIKGMDGGVEWGLLVEKYGCLDMIWLGGRVEGVECGDEGMVMGSVEKLWDEVVDILKDMGGRN